MTMETKLVRVWLVSSLIHTISGCSLSAPGGVTGYTGGSVVLSCFCTDGGTILRHSRWVFQPGPSAIALWSGRRVDDRYKDRALISDSPRNMFLLVGELTMETMLVCVWLVSSLIHMISGCSLSAPGGVTGYTGGSVVLSCSCTDGGTIPRFARWHFQPGPSSITLWSGGRVDDHYKDRALILVSP
ncbi:hypothetical protein COCON_G00136480 [Conger conger]|uniref:Uncharacterized protein n=1 Tax=Conger conger TaxID=82655 RepID=A0A9Q1DFC2_CONCO|nr:hypothetical protein COCON_G00136480 [Conger conger]